VERRRGKGGEDKGGEKIKRKKGKEMIRKEVVLSAGAENTNPPSM
jgi:hypothetical protein